MMDKQETWYDHAESEWKRKYDDDVFTAQAKLIFMEGYKSAMEKTLQAVTAQEGESEYMSGYADGVASVNAKEIAKRMIEEFKADEGSNWYTTSTKTWLKDLYHWLDKDGE